MVTTVATSSKITLVILSSWNFLSHNIATWDNAGSARSSNVFTSRWQQTAIKTKTKFYLPVVTDACSQQFDEIVIELVKSWYANGTPGLLCILYWELIDNHLYLANSHVSNIPALSLMLIHNGLGLKSKYYCLKQQNQNWILKYLVTKWW